MPLPVRSIRGPESLSLLTQDSRMPGSGTSNHPDGILSGASEAIFRCALKIKENTGSGDRNYRPAVSRHIRGRVRLPGPNMPGVTVIFICIKKRQKGGAISVPAAVRQEFHRYVTRVTQHKSRGLSSAVQMTLNHFKS